MQRRNSKNEPQDVDKSHAKDHGVEEKNHVETSTKHGRRRTTEVDRLRLDAAQNVGAPNS